MRDLFAFLKRAWSQVAGLSAANKFVIVHATRTEVVT